MVSSFLLYDAIGWTMTPLPLMIPKMFGTMSVVFFVKQYLASLPVDIINSAKLDGAGNFGIFFHIVIGVAKPIMVAQFVICFISAYNDYTNPLLYIHNTELYPCNDYTPEENAQMYKEFIQTAKKAGVKIATENMWNCVGWGTPEFRATPAACSSHENFKKHMELLTALDKDVFGACVDIGHAEMKGLDTSAVQMLETLGDYVTCIHLHDVDLVNDNHQLPFVCNIDYAPVIDAFKKIGYKGDITLESGTFSTTLPVELLPAGAKYAAAVAQYFKEKIESQN